MIVRSILQVPSFQAGDHTILKELLHPDKDDIELPYSLAYAILDAGTRSLVHQLQQSELYYFLEGSGCMHVAEEAQQVTTGTCILVPPGAIQWLENTGQGPLRFLCIVSPPWSADKEKIL